MEANRCPVCAARFRGTVECSRCGADLGPLMLWMARAWQARNQARSALLELDAATALTLARRAERMHSTSAGRALELLARLAAARGNDGGQGALDG